MNSFREKLHYNRSKALSNKKFYKSIGTFHRYRGLGALGAQARRRAPRGTSGRVPSECYTEVVNACRQRSCKNSEARSGKGCELLRVLWASLHKVHSCMKRTNPMHRQDIYHEASLGVF